MQGQPVVDKVLLLPEKESSRHLPAGEEEERSFLCGHRSFRDKGAKISERTNYRSGKIASPVIHGCVAINETISPIGLQRRCKRDRLRQRLKGRDRRAQAEPGSSGLSNPPCPSSTWIVDSGKRERERERKLIRAERMWRNNPRSLVNINAVEISSVSSFQTIPHQNTQGGIFLDIFKSIKDDRYPFVKISIYLLA